MAAAEYFNPNASMASGAPQAPAPGPGPQHPPPPNQIPPPQQPQRPNQSQNNLNLPYPISDAPPPYSAQPRPHSQPPPGQRIPQVQFSSTSQSYQPYRPGQPNVDTHQYPPDKLAQPQQRPPNVFRPSDPPPTLQQNGYPTVAAPGLSQVYQNGQWQQQRPSSAGQSPYRRSSRSRSRSRERRKHKHSKPRPEELPRKKEGGMNTFLGASGGAVIGDLIFPGLGTLGGAIIGGVGGECLSRIHFVHEPN